MTKICVFGASIGRGHNDEKNGGWAKLLHKYFKDNKLDFSIYNCSISGDTTKDLLKRFTTEAIARRSEIIIFDIGTNDSFLLNNDKNNPNVSIANFEKNIFELIRQAKKITPKIVFVGITNVDESKVKPIPWRKDAYYDNKNIVLYNGIIKTTCTQNKVYFLDMINKLNKKDLDDGLHPNSKGHMKMYKLIKDFLIDVKYVS